MFRILLVNFSAGLQSRRGTVCTSNVKNTAVPIINRNPKLQFNILTTSQCHRYLSTIVECRYSRRDVLSMWCEHFLNLLQSATNWGKPIWRIFCSQIFPALIEWLFAGFSRQNLTDFLLQRYM